MRDRERTRGLALCGVLAALSLGALWLSTVSLFARWSLVAVAGLFPAAAVIETGRKGGLGVWAAAGALGLLLTPDRLNALLYLLLFGLYPVVKSLLEEHLGRWLCFLGKLAFFNAVAGVLTVVFSQLFLAALPWDMTQEPYLIFLWGSVLFLAYDYGLSKLIAFYLLRVHPQRERGTR